MALASIIPGTTPFGQWAEDSRARIGMPSDPGYDARVIARWRTIQYIMIVTSPLGPVQSKLVIAVECIHINGIDKVEFACNGGTYVAVTRPIQEKFLPFIEDPLLASAPSGGNYWKCGVFAVILDAMDFPAGVPLGLAEVRAIVTPKTAGDPRILQQNAQQTRDLGERSLTVFVATLPGPDRYFALSGSDTTGNGTRLNPYRTARKAAAVAANAMTDPFQGGWRAIAVEAGDYVLDFQQSEQDFDATKTWGTVQGDGLLARDVVRISSPGQGLKAALLRLKHVAVRVGIKSASESQTGQDMAIWLDDVVAGAETDAGASNWPRGPIDEVSAFERGIIVTDSRIERVDQAAVGYTWIDRVIVDSTILDVFVNCPAIFDSSAINVSRLYGNSTGHNDFIQWNLQPQESNLIYSGLSNQMFDHGAPPLDMQTVFIRSTDPLATFEGVAIVNVKTIPSYILQVDPRSQVGVNARHFVMLHNSFSMRGFRFSRGKGATTEVKDLLMVGNALRAFDFENGVTGVNLQQRDNIVEIAPGLPNGMNNNDVAAPDPLGWDTATLRPNAGGNLDDQVSTWTVPIDLDGVARPFLFGSLFKATRCCYEV